MILLIDNYDSFSYNLYQLIGTLNADIKVFRNDKITIDEIKILKPDAIILSPGPGRPSDAGICEDIIRELGSNFPVFGVCLGHQAIVEALGGNVSYAKQLMHGKESKCFVETKSVLFKDIPGVIKVGRYHSLAANSNALPEMLRITAKTDDGEIMAVEAKEKPIFGVQFHPESIMTPQGLSIIQNFLRFAEDFNKNNERN